MSNTSSDQQYNTSSISNTSTKITQNDPPATSASSSPRRFIYTQKDMQQFMTSPTRRELLSFVTALGRSTITSSYTYDPQPSPSSPPPPPTTTTTTTATTTTTESSSSSSTTSPSVPQSAMIQGLSPGMASLHGSLRCMAEEWIAELPPDKTAKARFGNPMFKVWHDRLSGSADGEVEEEGSGGRSRQIVHTMMKCHVQYTIPMMAKRKARTSEGDDSTNDDDDDDGDDDDGWDLSILKQCSEAGYQAASTTTSSSNNDGTSSTTDTHTDTPLTNDTSTTTSQHDKVLNELQSYLNLSFGHPIRIDYGTGHESSFLVFLYSLCKVGIFGNDKSNAPNNNNNTISPDTMAPIALSIFSQYLEVCRGLQTEYMLEPAGSHGVWGLDDYHCIPFYVGACQLQNPRFTNTNTNTRGGMKGEGYKPSDIHDDHQLASDACQGLMYFQCIRYIKSIKRGVPFFESSPMLDDISRLGNWGKVSTGLLRLYEGEVLDKMPVVQHFVFGNIFKATWTPSEGPRKAPTRTFINGVPTTRLGTDRLHQPSTNSGATTTPAGNMTMPQPSTRAPWAK